MVKKVAISLPDELYERLEELRRKRGESRSLLIQEAVGEYVTDREKQAKIEAYIRGYTENPETEEDIAEAEALWLASREDIEREYPWEGPTPWDEDEDEEG